jgi:hypothetical protein
MPTFSPLNSDQSNPIQVGPRPTGEPRFSPIEQTSFEPQQMESTEPPRAGFLDPVQKFLEDNPAIPQFAQSVNIGIPALLDLPFHAVNWIAEKAGSDFRLPATMVDTWNNKMFGEGEDPNYMQPGAARELVDAAGTATAFAMGATPVSRSPGAMSLASDIFGLGSTTASATGRAVAPELGQALDADQLADIPVVSKSRNARQEAEDAVMRGEGEVQGAGLKYDPATNKVVKDPAAKEVIRQGIPAPTASMMSSSSRSGKQKMIDMLKLLKKTRANPRLAVTLRPSDMAGDSLLSRLKFVRNVNRNAGERLEEVAQTLKGQPVDFNPAVQSFLENLRGLKVKYNQKTGELNFKNSSIRGLGGLEKAIKKVVRQLEGTGTPDAFDVHEMKRILDEQVTYGKKTKQLSGKVMSTIKQLRHDLDGVLDANFPAYNQVNTQYSETIDALNDFQKAAGQKVDFRSGNANKALGRVSRVLMSNYGSRENLMNSIADMERLSNKYKTSGSKEIVPYKGGSKADRVNLPDLDDDLMGQVRFLSDIETHLGSYAPNSFQGIQEKVAAQAQQLELSRLDRSGVARVVNAFTERGKGQDEMIESMLKLLGDKPQSLLEPPP